MSTLLLLVFQRFVLISWRWFFYISVSFSNYILFSCNLEIQAKTKYSILNMLTTTRSAWKVL